jgi:hypothetical protein
VLDSPSPPQLLRRLVLTAAAAACLSAQPARAQQFVTDDAALTTPRACQLELWHGKVSSWVQPACHFVPGLELMAGVGLVDDGGARRAEYVLQGKYLLRETPEDGLGLGLVAGIGFDPRAQAVGGVEGVFVLVPASLSLRGGRLLLHGNLGWHFERTGHDPVHEGDDGHHGLNWTARADVRLPGAGDRLTVIGELFAEDRLRPEFQLGLRTVLAADRLSLDLSWGGHTDRPHRGAGWTAGLIWTPASLY